MIQAVLDELSKVKSTGSNKWTALCPGHEDTDPSLSIAEGRDGKVLVRCFKGCSFQTIVKSMPSLSMRDFFNKNKNWRDRDDYY
jgi:hypothetical protein